MRICCKEFPAMQCSGTSSSVHLMCIICVLFWYMDKHMSLGNLIKILKFTTSRSSVGSSWWVSQLVICSVFWQQRFPVWFSWPKREEEPRVEEDSGAEEEVSLTLQSHSSRPIYAPEGAVQREVEEEEAGKRDSEVSERVCEWVTRDWHWVNHFDGRPTW